MLDKEKTKTQLIRELGELRRQISRIEPLKAGRQQAKEALRDSEQKYRSLIANIPGVVWTTDSEGSTPFISSNVEKVYGFSPKEIYEQGAQLWYGRIHPDDVEKVKKSFRAVFEGGTQLNIEYRIRRKDGQWIWIHDRSIGAYEKDGVKYADGVFFDITDRKQAEEALLKSEEFAKASLNATADMMYLVEPNGKILTVNNIAAQNIGKTPDELIGTNIFDYFPPDVAKHRKEQGDEVVRSGKPIRFQDERKDKFFDISINPTFNVAGKVDRVAVFVTDITESKKAENELRQTKEFIDNAINAQIDTFFVFNPKTGKAIRWNENFSRISGYTDEEISVMKAPDSYYDQDDLEKANEGLKELAATGSATVELSLITKKGKRISFEYKVSLIEITGGENIAISIGRDVTKRKRAEEEVQKLATVVRHSSDLVNLATLDGMMIFLNEAGGNMLGIDPNEVEQVNIMQVIPDHLKELVETELLPTLKDSRTWEGELQYLNLKTGELTDVHAITFTVQDPLTSEPLYLANVSHDITDRKRAREELQRLTAILENTSDLVSTATPGHQLTYFNRAGRKLVGWGDDENLEGKKISDVHPKWAIDLIGTEGIPAAIRDGIWEGETAILDPDGKDIPVSQVIMSHKSPNGHLEYLSTIIRDITDRKRAEEQLRFMQFAVEHTANAAFWMGPDAQFTYVNEAACRSLGYTREELLSMTVCDIDPDFSPEVWPDHWREVKERGSFTIESHHRTKDGCVFPVEIRVNFLAYGDNEYNCAFARDITDRKRAEKKLLDYQDQLRSLASELSLAEERQRRQIATDLHDHISQALALSLLTLQTFRQSADSTNVHKLDEVCNTINEMIEHVRSLTFDLSPPTLYKFGLERAIAELVDDQLRRRHGIACEFFDDQADKPLEDDVRVLLFQSARELLINIIKHAQAHKVRVALQREGSNIQVCVSDNGIGFDVNKIRSAVPKRVGFGLFNIQERLDYIGGDFKVESQPGNGSRFTLTAPLKTKTVQS
jgi:PAS domain S-box-containing protein